MYDCDFLSEYESFEGVRIRASETYCNESFGCRRALVGYDEILNCIMRVMECIRVCWCTLQNFEDVCEDFSGVLKISQSRTSKLSLLHIENSSSIQNSQWYTSESFIQSGTHNRSPAQTQS